MDSELFSFVSTHFAKESHFGRRYGAWGRVGKGSIVVDTEVKGCVKTIAIKDVLHVPKLKANLSSVRHLVAKHLRVEFDDAESSVLLPSRDEVAITREIHDLYRFKFSKAHTGQWATLAQSSSKGWTSWDHDIVDSGHSSVKSAKAAWIYSNCMLILLHSLH